MDREAWESALRQSAWARGLKKPAGAVAGLLLEGQTTFLELGRGVDASTPMETGSVTKVFTGLLLADAVRRGEAELESRVDEVIFGERWDEAPAITLGALAMHTSGLPRLSMRPYAGLLGDPYRWYGEDHLLRFLRRTRPRTPAQPRFAYSNLGYAVLGLALERTAGKPYAELLQERVLAPLEMRHSALQLVGRTLVSRGFHRFGRRARPWHFKAYAPCGALVSTAEDLLRGLRALVEEPGTAGGGLGWMREERGDFAWHNGGTFGYSAYVGVSRARRAAVVLLANQAGAQPMTAVGHELMRGLAGTA